MDALHQARRGGLAASEAGWALQIGVARAPRADLARARRRHLGGARRAAALHLFQGDGLGRVRPRDQERGGVRAGGAGRALARACAAQIHDEVCRRGFDPRARQLRAVLRIASSSTPACCCCRRSASCRRDDPRVRGTVAAIERELLVDGFVLRYDTARPTTACRRARARSSPAASGWSTPMSCRSAGTTRAPVRSAARAAQRRRPAERGVRPAGASGWSAISRRPSRTSRWSTAPST